MKARIPPMCIRLLVVMIATAGSVTVASAQTLRYRVHDLGQVDGAGSSASSVNDSGIAVGWMETALRDTRATRAAADGVFKYLPGLESISSSASAINAVGDIAGSFQFSTSPTWAYHAMRYTDAGGIEDLGTLGGPTSVGSGINRYRQVAGSSYVSVTPFVMRGFLATPGQPLQNLGAFSSSWYASSFAVGINDSGEVAGHAETANGRWHAFRYKAGSGLQDLGTHVDYNSFASDINARGQVAGHVFSGAGEHAFRYTDGIGMQDLQALGTVSSAHSLNDHGDVVGYFRSSGEPSRAFLYTDAEGMIDLNTRIDAASGWVLNVATGINAEGEIVGQGTYTGQTQPRAFKLIPIPPDTTPPAIVSASPNPSVLWPPTGMMVDVHVSVNATDNAGPPHCSVDGVSSNEALLEGDAVLTADLSLQLRAARKPAGSGRTYLVALTCVDASANESRTSVEVRVPHDMDR